MLVFITVILIINKIQHIQCIFSREIKTMKNQNRVVTYKSVFFDLGGSFSHITPFFILENNPSFKFWRITLYYIFFEFGLMIPSCYAQGYLFAKVAPDSTLLRGCA